ncbi:hypothetical protein ACI76Q_09700 [Capnocytophaga canimorsus]|uniref:hypothetical protein n=1 Tax=Capnocytophaga canimorsus TaxID=28188 RepID=UPI0037D7892A
MKKVILMFVFLLFTMVVFSQKRSHNLSIYEGSITNLEEIFTLEKRGVTDVFEVTDWVYIKAGTLYLVGRLYAREYDTYLYVLIKDFTKPMCAVYKIANINEYDRLVSTMGKFGFLIAK